MGSVVLALLSSLLWGTADFMGGTASRRVPALSVVVGSQAFGLLGVGLLAVVAGEVDAPLDYLVWGVAAGLSGFAGLVSFYAALASGTMGVVAPIAATGVIVPVAVGLARGESPGVLQLVGVAVAVLGVVLATGPELRGRGGGSSSPGSRHPLLLAVVAALGFGCALVFLAEGARTSSAMTLVTMRVVTVFPVLVVALAMRSSGGLRRGDAGLLALIGLADAGANVTYAVATDTGLVSITAVLASLYPAVTVLLARLVHGERMRPVQDIGVVAVLCGVGFIAAGG